MNLSEDQVASLYRGISILRELNLSLERQIAEKSDQLKAVHDEILGVLLSAGPCPDLDAVRLHATMTISQIELNSSRRAPSLIGHYVENLVCAFKAEARAILSGEKPNPGGWKIPLSMRLRRMAGDSPEVWTQ